MSSFQSSSTFIIGIFKVLIPIFAKFPFIIRGPASLGFFNSMMAGKNRSMVVTVVVAIRVVINVFRL